MAQTMNHRHLHTLRKDETVPAVVRAAITDWLHRADIGRQAVHHMHAELEAAEQAVRQTIKHTGPERVLAMFAAGEVSTGKIAPDLDSLVAAERRAEMMLTITRQALRKAEAILERCFETCGEELLPWVAAHRVGTHPSRPVPAHVLYAWQVVRSCCRVILPAEAWLEQRDGMTVMLNPYSTPEVAGGDHRSWWAWHAIAQGRYTVEAGPVTVVTITAPWNAGNVAELEAAGETLTRRR